LVLSAGSPTVGLFCVAFALALYEVALPAPAGVTQDATVFGVADETGKFAEDGGAAFFVQLNGLRLRENRFVVRWNPAAPTTIPDKTFLDRSVPVAEQHGIRIVFDVFPLGARAITGSAPAAAQFVNFLQLVARTYRPDVVIVGNEPNQPRFWQPQFNPDGSGAAAAAFEALLARSYDALKAVDPSIVVVGGGPNSHGNDNPRAPDNVSRSPVRFIRDLGVAYRASGRQRPIMDELGFHAYPLLNTHPPTMPVEWPNAATANFGRIKQAVWDAFHGTAQPTFAEGRGAPSRALKLRLDEIGWQVEIVPSARGAYTGGETVKTIDEATQARFYTELVEGVSCDPAVSAMYFLQWFDERPLANFQAGLVRADGTRRPSYDAVRSAIARTGGRCPRTPVVWQHETGVVGASAKFGDLETTKPVRQTYWGFVALAGEEASYRAGVFRVGPPPLTTEERASIVRFLSSGAGTRPTLAASGDLRANIGRLVRFPSRRLAPGFYVYATRLQAAMNPERTSLLVSAPFQTGLGGTLPAPVFGRSVNLRAVRGVVLVRERGTNRFVRLTGREQLATGSEVDARRGVVNVVVASAGGALASATASRGRFVLTQIRSRTLKGGSIAILRLSGPFGCRAGGGRGRRLQVDARGVFRTIGRYGWATAEEGAATWRTQDLCAIPARGLAIADARRRRPGTCYSPSRREVCVHDPERKKDVPVRAGRRYCVAGR
jgi:hypothetical protein